MKVAELLFRLIPGPPNWRTSTLYTLASLSLKRIYIQEPPDVIVMPEFIAVLCDLLWQKTQEGRPPKEWIASLITLNGRDVYCHCEEGNLHDVQLLYIGANQRQQVGYMMSIHTHPGQGPPSPQDLYATLSTGREYVHPVCNIVVAGPHTFLILRRLQNREVIISIYYSTDRGTFRRLNSADVQRICRAV